MMTGDADEQFLMRALRLAARGRGHVEPNPLVGCVIVKAGRIIGEGFHHKFGGAHAEVEALRQCTESPAGSILYVNLEPCCHRNKKTPPCVPQLVTAGIGRVVIGCLDPNPDVSGRGAAALREAGIEVVAGVREAVSRQLNAPFFARQLLQRPYVTLKWAQSRSGQVGGVRRGGLWISSAASRHVVHELRSRCDAILVGLNTVLRDDPLLTARGVQSSRPLERIVLDRELLIPPGSRLVQSARESPVTVYRGAIGEAAAEDRSRLLSERGVCVVSVPLDMTGRIDLQEVVRDLGRRPITHLLVEPGPSLARSFFDANLADRVWVIQSPDEIPDPGADLYALAVPFPPTAEAPLECDRLIESLNPRSPVSYAGSASIDFELATRGDCADP